MVPVPGPSKEPSDAPVVAAHDQRSIRARMQPIVTAFPPLVWALALLLVAIHAVIFALEFKLNFNSDLFLHRKVVQAVLKTGTVPGDFLFYVTAAALAGFQRTNLVLDGAISAILALAVGAKFLISAGIALTETSRRALGGTLARKTGLVIAVALLSLAFSLPTD
jgi:hypothetical protein